MKNLYKVVGVVIGLALSVACSSSDSPLASGGGSGGSAAQSSVAGSGGTNVIASVVTASASAAASSGGSGGGGPPARPLDDLEEAFQKTFIPKLHSTDYPSPTDTKLMGYSPISLAAWNCIGAAAAERRARQGAAFDPQFRAELLPAAHAAADYIVAAASVWGGAGWGLPSEFATFGAADGPADPMGTVFSYESGFALWCLAEIADVTQESSYRALAEKAANQYLATGYADKSSAKYGGQMLCPTCGYFWYSLCPYDFGDYVKNTNIGMAIAFLVLDRYKPMPALRAAADAATQSQTHEIADHSNYTYVGIKDKRYPYLPWSHAALEILDLFRAGELLHDKSAIDASMKHYAACTAQKCDEEIAYVCQLARVSDDAKTRCLNDVYLYPDQVTGLFGLVLDYAN